MCTKWRLFYFPLTLLNFYFKQVNNWRPWGVFPPPSPLGVAVTFQGWVNTRWGGDAAWSSLVWPPPQLAGGALPHSLPCESLSHSLGATGNHSRERLETQGIFTPLPVLATALNFLLSPFPEAKCTAPLPAAECGVDAYQLYICRKVWISR